MKRPNQITVALRMPNGKRHILNSDTLNHEATISDATEWAVQTYGEQPRVVLCEVAKNSCQLHPEMDDGKSVA